MKIIVRKLIKWIWLVVVFVAVLELLARLGDTLRYDAPFWGDYSHLRLRTYDSDGIQYNIPLARFEKWQNNSLGFRGDEIALNKPAGTYRIACMGTSESYGLFEEPGKEWPRQLADKIGGNSRLEIINISVVGLPLSKFQPYFEKYVKKIAPDMVILLINPCSYVIESERLSNKPPDQTAPVPAKPAQPEFGLSSIKEYISNMRINDKLTKSIKRLIPSDILQKYQLRLSVKQVAEAERFRLINKSAYDTIPGKYIESYRKELQSLIDYYLANNMKVVLTSYPTLLSYENINMYPDLFLGARRYGVELSLKGMIDVTDKINRINEEMAVANGLDFVVLNELIPHTKDYFADNVHFTNKGAEFVAERVAVTISNSIPR
jgi:hypothetical protein